MRRTSSQTIATGGADIQWSVDDWDTDSMWAIGSPANVDINTAGRYAAYATGTFAASNTGRRAISVESSGGDVYAVRLMDLVNDWLEVPLNCGAITPELTTSFVLQAHADQNSGGNQTLLDTPCTLMGVHWMGKS